MDLTVCKKGTLEYLIAPGLDCPELCHGFTTRFGGVSRDYLDSLNLGTHRGDRPENVEENYRILGDALGFSPEATVFTRQRHTDLVRKVGRENRGEGLYRELPEQVVCDGQITNVPGVALMTFSADCTPVLLFDPVKKAIGAVHAGWRGTALGIVKKAVEAMSREYGSAPADIRAAIGPSIGPCCFETDWDVPQAMLEALGRETEGFIEKRGEKYFVDNKALNALWLRRAGVSQIDISQDCTKCQPNRFWSHRVTGGHRGSQGAVIMLREGGESQ